MSESTLKTCRLGPDIVNVTTPSGRSVVVRVATEGTYCQCAAYRDLGRVNSGPLCPYCQREADRAT